jgi:hypothetical protein
MIQSNSDFVAEIIKDAGVVDRRNESYQKFHTKYIKRCKKLIVNLSIFSTKPPTVPSNPSNGPSSLIVSGAVKAPGN